MIRTTPSKFSFLKILPPLQTRGISIVCPGRICWWWRWGGWAEIASRCSQWRRAYWIFWSSGANCGRQPANFSFWIFRLQANRCFRSGCRIFRLPTLWNLFLQNRAKLLKIPEGFLNLTLHKYLISAGSFALRQAQGDTAKITLHCCTQWHRFSFRATFLFLTVQILHNFQTRLLRSSQWRVKFLAMT